MGHYHVVVVVVFLSRVSASGQRDEALIYELWVASLVTKQQQDLCG